MSNFGIIAIETYFPKRYVDQRDLEIHDDCVGKYTIGLGQSKMSVTNSCEDVCSISLTVLKAILERTNTKPSEIGFLEVGSETLIDKAKSTKSVLMQIFDDNFDVAGTDSRNACFSGTAALFNALNWLQSSFWDGRLAVVVASDIAVYGCKITRPTGGVGAVAILLGPNAPILFEKNHIAHTMKHTYDFYKPQLASEYPCVIGHETMDCYKDALITSYQCLVHKLKAIKLSPYSANLNSFDYCCFHSPFVKLVIKSFYWIALESSRIFSDNLTEEQLDLEAINKDLHTDPKTKEKNSIEVLSKSFSKMVEPSLTFARNCGNMYSGALYANLISILIHIYLNEVVKSEDSKRILMFSFGSGFASALFSITVPVNKDVIRSVIGDPEEILHRLHMERVQISVKDYLKCLEDRELNHNKASIKPNVDEEFLFPGQYFLSSIDDLYRRSYIRYQKSLTDLNGS